ncbi:4172_t:CDS:2 [Racocetra fulgida]|uniref:4172_t:CDS:1 n=1 Tax=Racocetra fulgida TaxID=60492 RepID=A0A9N9CDP1_9GLOM|nr:4172_t:CDS:2 [Racocetra fulgida]
MSKLNQELSSIYSNDTNKDNIETFSKDLDNENEDDEIEDEDAMQQVIEKWIEMLEDEATENIK